MVAIAHPVSRLCWLAARCRRRKPGAEAELGGCSEPLAGVDVPVAAGLALREPVPDPIRVNRASFLQMSWSTMTRRGTLLLLGRDERSVSLVFIELSLRSDHGSQP